MRDEEHTVEMLGHDLKRNGTNTRIAPRNLLPAAPYALAKRREVNNGLSFFCPSKVAQPWLAAVGQGDGDLVDATASIVVTIETPEHGVFCGIAPTCAKDDVWSLVGHGLLNQIFRAVPCC